MAVRSDFPPKQIALLLGITERRLQQLAAEGWIPRGQIAGTYQMIGSVQGYIRYLKENSRDSARSTEHTRLARAQAVKVEMENARRAGEYVLRDQVLELGTELMAELVAAHEGIPGRTANEFAAATDPAFIRSRQQDELRAVRRRIADRLEQFAGALEHRANDGADGDAAAQEDGEPVGGREPHPTA